MERAVLIFFILIIIGSGALALKQVEPYSQTLEDFILVGKAVPDSKLELFFSKENEKFDTLRITNTLPEKFSVAIIEEFESFRVIITIPGELKKASYKLDLEFSNSDDLLSKESVETYFTIDSSLLFASMDNFSQEVLTGDEAVYSFTLINNSDAETNFRISSSLPSSWVKESGGVAHAESIEKYFVKVKPGIGGERDFIFTVHYGGEEKKFNSTIKANPTLESKFSSVLNGLPFYSFSLIPNYLLNGLFTLLF